MRIPKLSELKNLFQEPVQLNPEVEEKAISAPMGLDNFPFLLNPEINTFSSYSQMIAKYTGIVYRAAKFNAESVASVPLRLYVAKERNQGTFKTIETRKLASKAQDRLFANPKFFSITKRAIEIEEVTRHPILDCLKSWNAMEDQFSGLMLTELYLELVGISYWLLVPNRLGVPVEIWNLPAQNITVKTGDGNVLVQGYIYQRNGKQHHLSTDEVIQFRFAHPDSFIQGKGPLEAAAEVVLLRDEITATQKSSYKNALRPSIILSAPKNLSDTQYKRLLSTLKQKYSGSASAYLPMLLEGGTTPHTWQMSLKELEHVAGRELTAIEIGEIFDIPQGLLTSKDVNKANALVAERLYARRAVLPRIRRLEEKLNQSFVSKWDTGGKLFLAFDNPVPEDEEAQTKKLTLFVRGGIITANEAREEIGYGPKDGGDKLYPPAGSPQSGNVEPEKGAKAIQQIKPLDEDLFADSKTFEGRRLIWKATDRHVEEMSEKWYPVLNKFFGDQRDEVLRKLMLASDGDGNVDAKVLDEILEFVKSGQEELAKQALPVLTKIYAESGQRAIDAALERYRRELLED